MNAVKKAISIDEKIAKEVSALSPNFSAAVKAALVEYIHQHRVQKAINSFGKWAEREESSTYLVAALRSQDGRSI